MSIFTPDIMLHDVTRIDKSLLDANGICALILDVDNTLTEYGSQVVRQNVRDWLCKMNHAGIKLIIVSNNTRKRVEPFAKKLGLDYVSMSCKPLTIGLSRAQRKLSLPTRKIAIVGDQIYTDVVGGNLKGMYTILVTPFLVENNKFMKLKRNFEMVHIRDYQKKRGAFNER